MFFYKIETQAQKICDQITKNKEKTNTNIYEDGVYLIGLSQGGLVAREFMGICKAEVNVKGLITVGTPNLGIDIAPPALEKSNNFSDKMAKHFFNKVTKNRDPFFTVAPF